MCKYPVSNNQSAMEGIEMSNDIVLFLQLVRNPYRLEAGRSDLCKICTGHSHSTMCAKSAQVVYAKFA